jgi:hypothetical protein
MTLGDWELHVTGTIARIDRENLDKSGRHPKYLLSLVVTPAKVPVLPEGAMLPAELAVRVKSIDLPKLTPDELEPGDQVELTARANGPEPTTLRLTAIKKLDRR